MIIIVFIIHFVSCFKRPLSSLSPFFFAIFVHHFQVQIFFSMEGISTIYRHLLTYALWTGAFLHITESDWINVLLLIVYTVYKLYISYHVSLSFIAVFLFPSCHLALSRVFHFFIFFTFLCLWVCLYILSSHITHSSNFRIHACGFLSHDASFSSSR